MPDLFVAPEDKQKEEDLRQRRPLDNSSIRIPDTPSAKPIQQVEPTHEIKTDYSSAKPVSEIDKETAPKTSPDTASSSLIRKTVKKENNLEENAEQANSIPIFASFWQNPKGVYFDTQEIDEHILLFVRRHPITNLGWIFSTILLCLVPIAVFYAGGFLGRSFIIGSQNFTTAIILFYYMIIAASAFTNFLNWYYNISLITEKRVIDIELSNLIGKKVSATKIALVQDVNYEQNGTLRSVFDYGDVLIQTAGTVDNFYVNAAPRPEVVVRIIEDLIGEEGRRV